MDTVGLPFRSFKGDQGRRGAVLVRMKCDWGSGGEAVEMLQKLYRMHDGWSDLPLMAYRGYVRWQGRIRGQETQCSRRGPPVVAET